MILSFLGKVGCADIKVPFFCAQKWYNFVIYSNVKTHSSRSAFTLIELLVVIAIIAILAVVVVLTLNPAELLRQSRDANRVSDMATLNSALNLYVTDQSAASSFSLGTATTSYLSTFDTSATSTAGDQCQGLGMPSSTWTYHCAASSTNRNASSQGWIPVNLSTISAGSPLSNLPVDPTNQTSSNLYYTYATNGTQYEVSAFMESNKYAKQGAGGSDPTLVETGSGASTLPDTGRGLVGYWPLNEGTGSTAVDWSGSGDNGTLSGSTWTSGKTSASAALLGSGGSINFLSAPYMPNSQLTISAWVNFPAIVNYQNVLVSNNWGSNGSWVLSVGSRPTPLVFSIFQGSAITDGCSTSINTSTWYYVVGTYNGNTLSVYLNGNICGTATLSGETLTGATFSALAPSGGPFSINDIRLYNRALSSAEIQQIYNAEE